jgi:hypothetical protein
MLRWLALCAAVALLAAPAAFAQGSTRDKILGECEAGELRGSYTAKQLRDARNNIPGDLRQYTDCEEIIERALTGLGGGGSSRGPTATPVPSPPSGGVEGGAAPAPAPVPDTGGTASGGERRRTPRKATTVDPAGPNEQQALSEAAADPGGPVRLDEGDITPGAVGLTSTSIRQDLPRPVLAVLLLLALAVVAALVPGVRRLVARRRPAP